MKFRSILVVALTMSALPAIAQDEARGISVYSGYGYGMPVDYRSQAAASMGVTGIATFTRLGTNNGNPALWGNTYFTNAGGGLGLRSTHSTDGTASATNGQFDIYGLQLLLPIVREQVGLSFGIQPLTEVSYATFGMVETLPGGPGSTDTVRYQNSISGKGGLNRLELGLGWRISGNWSVGYAPSLVFGTTRRNEENRFATAGLLSSSTEIKNSHIGFGNRFGVLGNFRNLLRQNDLLAIGATYTLPVHLNAERTETVTQQYSDTNFGTIRSFVDQTDLGSGESGLPSEIGVGISYYPNSFWTLAGEALYQNWGEAPTFEGGTDPVLKNRLRVGFGGQYAAALRTDRTFWSHFVYRGGVSYDTGHLEFAGSPVSTLLFTTGIGIPSRAGGSSIDMGIEFGFRGTTSHDLVRERIFGIRLAFNLSEPMFFQRKLD